MPYLLQAAAVIFAWSGSVVVVHWFCVRPQILKIERMRYAGFVGDAPKPPITPTAGDEIRED